MTSTRLSPAQQLAFDELMQSLSSGNVFALTGAHGAGRTTVLGEVQRAGGGVLLSIKEFEDAHRGEHPLAMEETLTHLVMQALSTHDRVILDDLDVLEGATQGMFARSGFFQAPLKGAAAYAEAAGKQLILGGTVGALRDRACWFGIPSFTPADYRLLCERFLGAAEVALSFEADRDGRGEPPASSAPYLDFEKIHRFAPSLNAHQLKSTCAWLRRFGGLDTEGFIEHLRTRHFISNVDLEEVQAVDLHDLKGVDDLIESLEANVILPIENEDLAAELGLKPKRGVLLAGPPGTGKTTVGRALAHRLKGRFFLVDGTFISGTQSFYQNIQRVVNAAKQGGSTILFIDDSDVIFESGQESGLYRYLLTMLDGLESKSMGRICVMMTAMDMGNLPPALLRSGRIELWLETRLPDEASRAAILAQHLDGLPAAFGAVDVAALAAGTEGLTGADLKRLVEDGKLLFAHDKARSLPLHPVTEYFLVAVETLRANKARYAQAEAHARVQRPSRPQWFDVSMAIPATIAGSGGLATWQSTWTRESS